VPEIVKRRGDREDFDGTKLARSLRQAGVPVFFVSAMVARVCMRAVQNTAEMRTRIEQELARRYPLAARNYALTRRRFATASNNVDHGQVGLHSITASQLSVGHRDAIWVQQHGPVISLIAVIMPDLTPDHIRLNSEDLAHAGMQPDARVMVAKPRIAGPTAGPRMSPSLH